MKHIASLALVALVEFACSSTDAARPSPGADGGNQGGGKDASGCDESICEGVKYKGATLTTCCFSARGCGVVLDGKCVAPNTVRKLEPDAGGRPSFGTAETVVHDPSCPDQTFSMGTTVVLKGCCDKSGFCGASTENLGTNIGFAIPAMCVTRSESIQFGQKPPADAGPEKTCNYPPEGGAPRDAGAHD